MALTIRTESRDGIIVLYPEGFINAHTVNQFEEALQELVKGEQYRILIHCGKLQYISSAGLGALMGVIEEVRSHAGDIRLCAMSDSVYNVFDILGFTELYKIFPDDAGAIASFQE